MKFECMVQYVNKWSRANIEPCYIHTIFEHTSQACGPATYFENPRRPFCISKCVNNKCKKSDRSDVDKSMI